MFVITLLKISLTYFMCSSIDRKFHKFRICEYILFDQTVENFASFCVCFVLLNYFIGKLSILPPDMYEDRKTCL